MAVNNNGNLLDSAGNVAVDFVWGNIPMQPNDARDESVQGDLSATGGDNVIAYAKWNGYPLFTANSVGAGVGYVVVPSVLGVVTATAVDVLDDAVLTVTTAAGASNVGKTITAAARTAGSAVISITCGSHGFVAGNKVTVSDVSGGDGVNGVWTVLAVTNANVFTVTGTATTVQALTSLAGVVSGVAGTIKTQSVAAGGATIAIGQAVTITPWATAS
jgi:hypothetical protein